MRSVRTDTCIRIAGAVWPRDPAVRLRRSNRPGGPTGHHWHHYWDY